MSTLRDFFPPVTLSIQPFMQVQDQKPTGNEGGNSAIGANNRILNTVVANNIIGASLASNIVTLPAGTYYMEATAPVRGCGNTVSIISLSTGQNFKSGPSRNFPTDVGTVSSISGLVTATAALTARIITYCDKVAAGYGLGTGESNSPETFTVFSDLRIWQLQEGI